MFAKERFRSLFEFKGAAEKILTMELTESTKKELQARVKAIDEEIDRICSEKVSI